MMDFLADVYGLDVIDFGPYRPGTGLLLTAGSGLMMSVMDQLVAFRWAIDLDGVSKRYRQGLRPWLRCAERQASAVAFAGWYTATNPSHVVYALRGLRRPPVVYARCLGSLGDPFASIRTAETLADFLEQCHERLAAALARPGGWHVSQQRLERKDAGERSEPLCQRSSCGE